MRRTLYFLIQKEFKQVFRNKAMRPLLFIMPFIQLIILGNAATFELTHLDIAVIDHSVSAESRTLVQKLDAVEVIYLKQVGTAHADPAELLVRGVADVIVIIPSNFSEDLNQSAESAKIQLLVDAVDGNAAQIGAGYIRAVIQDFAEDTGIEVREESGVIMSARYLFNPELEYSHYMVPGILVLLITMIGVFLTSMNIVREREVGTIDQLNVTPISKSAFIIGKLLPFGIIGLVELTLGLAIAKWLFDVPFVGGLLPIYLVAVVYLAGVLALGLYISTISGTMQQALFGSWFILIVFILMSGLFTPIESMPGWAQTLAQFNPVTHFIEITRRVMLTGAGWSDILHPFLKLSFLTVVFNVAAVMRFKKGEG